MEYQRIQEETISVASILKELSLQMYEYQREEYIKRGIAADERQKAYRAKRNYRKSENHTKYYKDIQVGEHY